MIRNCSEPVERRSWTPIFLKNPAQSWKKNNAPPSVGMMQYAKSTTAMAWSEVQ